MGIKRLLEFGDSPFSWAIAGLAVGLGLGFTQASVWILTAGLVGFIVYLVGHGPARVETEGRLFSASGLYVTSWLIGSVVRGLIS